MKEETWIQNTGFLYFFCLIHSNVFHVYIMLRICGKRKPMDWEDGGKLEIQYYFFILFIAQKA
jgi:hypothetical protein